MFEDSKEVITNRKSKDSYGQHNGKKQKDKQRSTKHYAEKLKIGQQEPH